MASRVESSGVSVVSEDRVSIKKCHDDDDDDCAESVYNSKTRSAYLGGHKKKLHPLLLGPSKRDQGKFVPLHAASKSNLSEFTQRVMSAKLLRIKQVQNQLSETQIQLNELMNENRILRNLQKRQEGALRKYEGNHAELPQLIRSHNEEIRTLKASNKLIKTQLRETNGKLKERETELEALRENYNKLKKLSSEKNLLEREKLQKKVEELQDVVKEQDEKIQVLSRKILLESKNYRHHLNIETNKHKETQKDLTNALAMITRLENQLMMKERASFGPTALAKLPGKRDTKSIAPTVLNKSLEHQSSLGNLENALKEEIAGKSRSELSETPETDFEFLNALASAEDTPSPTHDIFPDVNASKGTTPEVRCPDLSDKRRSSTERKAEDGSEKPVKTRLPPAKHPTKQLLSGDPPSNAKGILDKIARNIESMDGLVRNNDLATAVSKARLTSLYEELDSNVTKIEEKLNSECPQEKKEDTDASPPAPSGSLRKNVSKRKLDLEKENAKVCEELNDEVDQLSPLHQQKYISMTKKWNDIKDKVQEEWMKAEQKMKELENVVPEQSEGEDNVEDKDEEEIREEIRPRKHVELALNRPCIDDSVLLEELEKTDKVLKKLKNETKGCTKRETEARKGKSKEVVQENVNFRTQSRVMPKYLDDFQSEYQKQNLLKALKAIDVGKDVNSSDSGDEESPGRRRPSASLNPSTATATPAPVSRAPSTDKAKNSLIHELFGSSTSRKKFDRNDTMNLEYGIIETIKARNN